MKGLAPEVILSVVFGLQMLVVAWRSGNDLFVEAQAWWMIAEKIQKMRNFSGLYFNPVLFFGTVCGVCVVLRPGIQHG